MTTPNQGALARQLERYYVRFNEAFWKFFMADVVPLLPDGEPPVIADLGCGPGLFLRDVRERLHQAKLVGVDYADDMIAHAEGVDYAGEAPTIVKGDVAKDLPLPDSSVDLLTITAVLHTFEDPFAFLDAARRVLAPNGMLLVYDWVRVPFSDYLDYRQREPGDPEELRYPRALRMFATHNKYTADDWLWIFDRADFHVIKESGPYPRAIALLTQPV